MNDQTCSLKAIVAEVRELERHIHVPFEAQAVSRDVEQYAHVSTILRKLEATSQQHIDDLSDVLLEMDGHAAPDQPDPSQVERALLEAIDPFQRTKVSRKLRDDSAALSFCAAGYTVLQTVATALGEEAISEIAALHLRDYAELVMELSQALPVVVLAELAEFGIDVDPSMAHPARRAAEDAWRRHATAITGTIDIDDFVEIDAE